LRSKNISTEDMMDDILNSLNKWFKNFDSFGFFYIKEYWLRYINEIGCKVVIKNWNESVTGIFRGISNSGKLILERDGRNLLISSGDMFLNREGITVDYG